MMLDDYQIPAVALLGALLLAFGYLYARLRDARTLLWLFGVGCMLVYAIFFWRVTMSVNQPMRWLFHGTLPLSSSWMCVVGQTALIVASALLLASLSPLAFRLGRRRILYVIPYIAPLIVYTILSYGPLPHPHGGQIWIYPVLAWMAIAVAGLWSLRDGVIPVWLAESVVLAAAVGCGWFFLHGNIDWPLWIGISGNLLMTALLVIFTWRRATPGVLLSVVGLMVWAIPPFMGVQAGSTGGWMISLARAWVLSKVLLAVGLLLLAMEDEIDANALAGRRERRIRTELQTYAQQPLGARSLRQFDEQTAAICAMIAANSRFSRVALVLRNRSGHFTVVGSAGLDRAAVSSLDAALEHVPSSALSHALPPCIPGAAARSLDLHLWLRPGDDLESLHLTRFTAVLLGSAEADVDGAFLLTGEAASPLVPDDLLPLQILAERMRAARAQSFTMGKLIDAERSTGAGLLAIRMAQQLHNPLTVVLGYGSLLEEMITSGQNNGLERTAIKALLQEARRMRAVLERMAQLSRQDSERYTEFSIEDLLTDAEQLHRPDFLCESIEFSMRVPGDLPRLVGNSHRIRQALMHALQYAISAVERQRVGKRKSIQMEVLRHGDRIRVQVQHSGPHLPHPDRVLHALDTGSEAEVMTGIGLSLSAEILREYGGALEAANLEASGPEAPSMEFSALDRSGVRITLDIPIRESTPRL